MSQLTERLDLKEGDTQSQDPHAPPLPADPVNRTPKHSQQQLKQGKLGGSRNKVCISFKFYPVEKFCNVKEKFCFPSLLKSSVTFLLKSSVTTTT